MGNTDRRPFSLSPSNPAPEPARTLHPWTRGAETLSQGKLSFPELSFMIIHNRISSWIGSVLCCLATQNFRYSTKLSLFFNFSELLWNHKGSVTWFRRWQSLYSCFVFGSSFLRWKKERICNLHLLTTSFFLLWQKHSIFNAHVCMQTTNVFCRESLRREIAGRTGTGRNLIHAVPFIRDTL